MVGIRSWDIIMPLRKSLILYYCFMGMGNMPRSITQMLNPFEDDETEAVFGSKDAPGLSIKGRNACL